MSASAEAGPESGPPRTMTVAELAHRWQVSKMTVYRLLNHGALPSLRIGRQFRVLLEDVLSYEESVSSGPPPT